MNETRKEQLNIRVTPQEKEMIEKGAKKENRSITNFIVWLAQQFTKKQK